MPSLHNLGSFLLLASAAFDVVSTYPFQSTLPINTALTPRADASPSQSSASEKTTAPPAQPSKSSTSDNDKTTGKETGSLSATKTSESGTNSGHLSINSTAVAGSIVMISPSAGITYYKIGDPITFSWNYTGVLATPTEITVQVTLSSQADTWPVANNLTFKDTSAVWDTKQAEANSAVPFKEGMYNLVIFDGGNPGQATALPSPGYLTPFDTLPLYLYLPRAPTPYASYSCAVCDSGSISSLDIPTIRFIFGIALITSLSFVSFLNIFS